MPKTGGIRFYQELHFMNMCKGWHYSRLDLQTTDAMVMTCLMDAETDKGRNYDGAILR